MYVCTMIFTNAMYFSRKFIVLNGATKALLASCFSSLDAMLTLTRFLTLRWQYVNTQASGVTACLGVSVSFLQTRYD